MSRANPWLRSSAICRKELRGTLLSAALILAAGPAHANSVLERVLRQISVSGLFVNAAQNGFASDRTRISANVTNLLSAQISENAHIGIWSVPEVAIGNMETVALGATNAGEHIFGLTAQVVPSKQHENMVLTDIMGASTLLLGANSSRQHSIDLANIDDLIASTMRSEFQVWQSGSGSDATIAALNLAANGGDVTARVLNHVKAVKLTTKDITSTAIGSVNASVTKVVGSRQR